MSSTSSTAFLPSLWGLTTITDHLDFGNPATASMKPGSIYYLPPFSQLSPSQLTHRMKHRLCIYPEGIFGHPVLITSINPHRSEASILIITSAGGKPFQHLHPNLQIHGVPIWPNDPHPLNNSIVCLKNEWSLPKECYINTVREYVVPCRILKPLFDQKNGDLFQLRDDSLAFIKACSREASRMPFSRSTRSLSPATSFESDESDGGVRLSPFMSLAALPPRALIRYSVEELLALRLGAAEICDVELLSSAAGTTYPSPLTSPSAPLKRPLEECTNNTLPLPSSSSSSASTSTWRSSRTSSSSSSSSSSSLSSSSSSSVSNKRYIDSATLDLFFPTAARKPSVQKPSYIDAEELDAYFPSPPPQSAATSRPNIAMPCRSGMAQAMGACITDVVSCDVFREGLVFGSSASASAPSCFPSQNQTQKIASPIVLPVHYSTLEITPDFRIDLTTTAEFYSSTTYGVTTYMITTCHASGIRFQSRLGTECYWVDGF